MSASTSIEWTDATWGPVRGCSRVSPGCQNCYAERLAARFSGPGLAYENLARLTPSGPRWTGVVRLVEEHLEDPIRWRKPRRIFVNSMSDLFHEALSFEDIRRVFVVMAAARQHTFQVLTKRPARMLEFFEWLDPAADRVVGWSGARLLSVCAMQPWPLRHVWLGVSVEDQTRADERISPLLHTPAAVRFLSCEPLLGPIDFRPCRRCNHPGDVLEWPCSWCKGRRFEVPDWVIIGGESGPGARPMDLRWAASIVDQCRAAGAAVFVKQAGSRPLIDGAPFPVDDSKGGDLTELPHTLRVREFPVIHTPSTL